MTEQELNTLIELITKLNKRQYEKLRSMFDIAFSVSSEGAVLEMNEEKKKFLVRVIKDDTYVGAYPLAVSFSGKAEK